MKPHYSNSKSKALKENYRPVSLMNLRCKYPQQTLTNQMQQCMKRIVHTMSNGIYSNVGKDSSIPKSINEIHHINGLKKKITWSYWIDEEKAFDNIQHYSW